MEGGKVWLEMCSFGCFSFLFLPPSPAVIMREVPTRITTWCLSFHSPFPTSSVDAEIPISLGFRRLSRFNGFVYSMGYLSLFKSCFPLIIPPYFHNCGEFSSFPPALKYHFLHPHFLPPPSAKEGYYLLFRLFIFYFSLRTAWAGEIGIPAFFLFNEKSHCSRKFLPWYTFFVASIMTVLSLSLSPAPFSPYSFLLFPMVRILFNAEDQWYRMTSWNVN